MENIKTIILFLAIVFSIKLSSQKKVDADKFYSFTNNYALVKKGMI